MIDQIRTALDRSRPTLMQDMAGAASLVVILVVSLYLPGAI